jgi:NAD(P)-dependent dehydrogenase (short-subunit alcohol dehydrogenase family)
VSSYYAAPLLLKSQKALVANISYYGAVSYHLDPAYGATKAGLDKMTWDMAQDFKAHRVAVVSIWPGHTATERAVSLISQTPRGNERIASFETPQFTGRVVEALYGDPDLMTKSGQVVIGAEAAVEYGFTDINGSQPPSLRKELGSPRPY